MTAVTNSASRQLSGGPQDADMAQFQRMLRDAASVKISAKSARHFETAATFRFQHARGLAAVCSIIAMELSAFEVLAGIESSPAAPIDRNLRSFVVGWCAGVAKFYTWPGVAHMSFRAPSRRDVVMGVGGMRLLQQAIKLGWIPDDATAMTWFCSGWTEAVRQQVAIDEEEEQAEGGDLDLEVLVPYGHEIEAVGELEGNPHIVLVGGEYEVCLDAAASSGTGSVGDEVTSAPTIAGIFARLVASREDDVEPQSAHFLVGWCVGYIELHTPPGLTERAIRRACNSTYEMDERGLRLLREAIKLGYLPREQDAVRSYREGRMFAISHWHNCILGRDLLARE
jgi:hypothetical protein